ncbi:Signal transduction histidine kinase [Sinosporangium album]|uniref:histidine kinase n=1 Tax=Sinosporangium album TaxID=504805 RepID=A0A1G8JSW2_9ACTN|nr:Signal transduction histidine kinase [Sinosporangium album]
MTGSSGNRSAASTLWRVRDVRAGLLSWVLPAAAFCGAFVPAALPEAQAYGYAATLAGLPAHLPAAYVPASVVGLLAALAARAAPGRPWLLLVLASADAVLRTPGLLLAVASYVAATALRRPAPLALYSALASLVAVIPQPGAGLVSALGGAPLFVWLPLALGLWAGARRELVAGLRERAWRLEREQAARTEQARALERARIAREMHDVVTHRVSLMVLRAGALEINATDEKTAAEAELIRVTGKDALTELRAVLGVLGEEGGDYHPRPTLADLDGLLEQSRSAGVPVERHEEGDPGALPVMVQHTAYRVVQEALTNIHKHAGRAATQVVLRHLPAALQVDVRNAAPPEPALDLPSGGSGLLGLRERVELLGGQFTAGAEPDGGFLVSVRLPT